MGKHKREFKEEGDVTTMEKTIGFTTEKERHYFLFTDLFLITEENGKNFRVRQSFNLKDVELTDDPNSIFLLCTSEIRQTFFFESF